VEITIDQTKRSDLNLARYTAELPEDLSNFSEIIYTSQKMKVVVSLAARAAGFEDVPILLLGEPGTGKDLFARAIHKQSRRNGKLQALNCGAYPSTLLAAELFGAEKGAYTGATWRQGAIRAARNGTLFLDEIGELPAEVQPTLLRFLQSGEVPKLGTEDVEIVPTRVIAATNQNLFEMCRQGKFREDLLFRLDIIRVNIPPLREYVEDIGLIAEHLLGKIIRKHKKKMKLAPDAIDRMRAYHWPGNVRELHAVLMRCYVLGRGSTITDEAVQQAILPSLDQKAAAVENLDDAVARFGKTLIDQAMSMSGGKKAAAARLIGLNSAQTLTNRYGVYQQRLALTKKNH
jgi:transcriptional regulator with PAS, ATPase and Fis domain